MHVLPDSKSFLRSTNPNFIKQVFISIHLSQKESDFLFHRSPAWHGAKTQWVTRASRCHHTAFVGWQQSDLEAKHKASKADLHRHSLFFRKFPANEARLLQIFHLLLQTESNPKKQYISSGLLKPSFEINSKEAHGQNQDHSLHEATSEDAGKSL
ncbi:MAG: hypothetical protein JSC161_000056 [Candidatus Tokpelaia sp. JSC161]|jgi:hypothetical protein|nr:MAG: hypothetical protein JSC161_000056 [Candidatus Tokpelaia sp. JSC161]